MHEEEVDVTGWCSLVAVFADPIYLHTVVDDESLVAGGHEVTGLLVGAVANLSRLSARVPHNPHYAHPSAS